MMRTNMLIVSAVLALPVGFSAMGGSVPSLALPADEAKTAEGVIKSVDATGSSFVISTGVGNDKKDVTIKFNNDTKYTLDGKDSTKDAALVVGHRAKVTHTNSVASRVDAKIEKPKK